VASSHTILEGMVMSWRGFSASLNYQSGEYPDTCVLFLSASGTVPANQDYLYVDDLVFTGNVPTAVNEINPAVLPVKIYPNPADDRLQLTFLSVIDVPLSVEFFNSMGQPVFRKTLTSASTVINTGYIPEGIYTYIVRDRLRTIRNSGKVLIIHN
jgi:hypothetical protein